MLFLLNDRIVEVAAPESWVQHRWRALGCPDPRELRAQDAIDFVTDQVSQHNRAGYELSDDKARDLAALIIAKTGANSLILRPTASGGFEPHLRDIPLMVLETYQRGAANDGGPVPARREA